jgi:integrase
LSRQQLPPQIRKIGITDRATGKPGVRYQVTVDVGIDPQTGKRQRVRRRYATEREARDALAELSNSVATGTFVSRSALTVERACAEWLAGKHRIRPTTRAAYEHALAPLRQRHGDMPVQQLTKAHLDALVSDLVAGKCGGGRVAGRGARGGCRKWTANSINPMLNLVSAVLADQVKQGNLTRDVAALVDRMARPNKKLKTFTETEVARLLAHVKDDRLAVAWHLALSGLRRGEVCGLRWSDVDLVAGTITVAHNRVSVNGRAMDGQPKTDRSARTLPLTPVLTTALRRALAGQKAERLALGPDYGPGDHVVCDEAGRPYHPDTISDYWRALCVAAKVPTIRLHDARHTCGTLMHLQGVPIVVISA